jgi:hypothetical protein
VRRSVQGAPHEVPWRRSGTRRRRGGARGKGTVGRAVRAGSSADGGAGSREGARVHDTSIFYLNCESSNIILPTEDIPCGAWRRRRNTHTCG